MLQARSGVGSLVVLIATLLTLTACGGGGDPDISTFEQKWHAAINNQQYDRLYTLLDSAGQRRFRQELEELRGLSKSVQQQVIDQLGGHRIESLDQLTPPEYFARLWHQTIKGRRPTMQVRAHGNGLGEMILELDDAKLKIDLAVEGGRWVWRLPSQEFDRPALGGEQP